MRLVTLLAASLFLLPDPVVLAQGNPPQAEAPPWLRNALRLKEKAVEINKQDIMNLWKDLRTNWDKLEVEEVNDRLERIRARLESDLAILKSVHTEGTPTVYSVAMEQLVGKGYAPGLLKEAVLLLESKDGPVLLKDGPEALSKPPRDHEIAVVKTLLLYANVIAADEENLTRYVTDRRLYNKVQLIYPVTNGKSVPSSVAKVALACKGKSSTCLQLPNAGFVSAGDPVNGQIRGLETAAFTQFCLRAPNKLNSAAFDALWKSMMQGEPGGGAVWRQLDFPVDDHYFSRTHQPVVIRSPVESA